MSDVHESPDVRLLASRAYELDRSERAAFLDRTCGGRQELRAAIEDELQRLERDLTRTRSLAPHPTGKLPPIDAFPGYEITRELRRGGQGVVYQAIQTATKRKVAIKVLLGGRFAADAARKRFDREIKTAASLRHPDIISIFHADVTHEGLPYFVMDYIRGETLDQYVRRQKPTIHSVLNLYARICRSVDYAHQHGVLHRDLKPSNILVDDDGNPKILDFGLAKWLAAPAGELITESHDAVGTLPYMAPEQTRRDPSVVDARTDVYALGVILYYILTGDFPYSVTGAWSDVFEHILHDPPTPPDKKWSPESGVRREEGDKSDRCPIDGDLRTIILTALAKQRDWRYPSAAALADDLERYIAGEPIHAKGQRWPYLAAMRARKFIHRHPLVAQLIVVWIAAFVTEHFVLRAAYSLTPFRSWYENMLTSRISPPAWSRFEHVRVVAITGKTDVESLAGALGVGNVTRENNSSLRSLHGRLMEILADADPRAVAWDFAFPAETAYDEAFAHGVQTLAQRNIPTVVGTPDWSADEAGRPRISKTIRERVRYGGMTISAHGRRGVDLCLQRGDGPAAPSLVLATLAAVLYPTESASWSLDAGAHSLCVAYQSVDQVFNPHWCGRNDRLLLTEVEFVQDAVPECGIEQGDKIGFLATSIPGDDALSQATISYEEIFKMPEERLREWFGGKIVLVADFRNPADWHYRPEDQRLIQGCYVHAASLETLLNGAVLHVPGATPVRLILYGSAVCGVLLAAAARGSRVRMAALLGVATTFAIVLCLLVFQRNQILCNPLAPVGALLLAAALGTLARQTSRLHA